MCANSQGSHRCLHRGTEPFATADHCARVGPDDANPSEPHPCGACCRHLAADAERDEYVRLGLPSVTA